MRIKRLELTNFRTFSHVLLDNIPDAVVLVSPNGGGKSTLLEALAGAKELASPYHGGEYNFREQVAGRGHSKVWPHFLRPPLRVGAANATIRVEVEPSEAERAALIRKPLAPGNGLAAFSIVDGKVIASEQINAVAKELFSYHPPTSGIGFFDYIKATRIYLNQNVGSVDSAGSDSAIQGALGGFHRDWSDTGKFSGFKTFITASVIDDTTSARLTEKPVDSLALFREVFDSFFAPKRFIGPQKRRPGAPLEILVSTPAGEHDIDLLSDGEKEILHIFGYLYQFRDLENIFLWDTPESHLNAALESRLFAALKKIAPKNQFWIATHSTGFINTVPMESLFVIRPGPGGSYVEQMSEPVRQTKIRIFKELGAKVGLQLVSSVVVFVEGKDAESDKTTLDRFIAADAPSVNLVAGGDCDGVLALGSKTNKLVAEACTNGRFLAIVDRDYRSDSDVKREEAKYNGGVFIWHVHEIENLFLRPSILKPTFHLIGRANEWSDESRILADLRTVAMELREWISADWVRWEIHQGLKRPGGHIAPSAPLDSLKEYGTRWQSPLKTVLGDRTIEDAYNEKLAAFDALMRGDRWLDLLPGKQILKRFLGKHGGFDEKSYIATATGMAIEKEIDIPEISRLRTAIEGISAQRPPN